MNDLPRQKLREIISQHGRSVCDNPQLCKGLLLDLCGEHKREVNVLIAVLEEHVAADLMQSSEAVPNEILLARLTRRVCDNRGLAEDAARWGVESWALALGMSINTTSKTPKTSRTKATASTKTPPDTASKTPGAKTSPKKKSPDAEIVDEATIRSQIEERRLKQAENVVPAKTPPKTSSDAEIVAQAESMRQLEERFQEQLPSTAEAKKEPVVSSQAQQLVTPEPVSVTPPQKATSTSSSCGAAIGVFVVIIILIGLIGGINSCISSNNQQQAIQATATADAAYQATQYAQTQATRDAQATQYAQNAQATETAQAIIPPPSSSQAKVMITSYYDNKGVFAGTYVLKQIDHITFGAQNGNQFTACAAYEYANPSTPNVSAGADSRTFLFQYTNPSWQVVNMGDALSC